VAIAPLFIVNFASIERPIVYLGGDCPACSDIHWCTGYQYIGFYMCPMIIYTDRETLLFPVWGLKSKNKKYNKIEPA